MQAFAKLLGHSQSKNMADGFAAASAAGGSAAGASAVGGGGSNASAVPLPAASDATYSPSAASSGGAHPQPKVEPIAHLPTVLPAPPPGLLGTHGTRPPPGHLLDVTPSYIVYSVKNGLVRVLDRGDGSKTLLRGHTAKVGDVAFFSAETAGGAASGGAAAAAAGADVLATVGGEGDQCSVLVWRLLGGSNSAGAADGELRGEKLLEVRFRPVPRRLVWHPFDPNKFVLLHGSGGQSQSRTVATLVETTRLVTVPHTDPSAHAVCLCGGASDPNVQSASADGVGGDEIEGALKLIVSGPVGGSAGNGASGGGVGANDLVFSPTSARHILTAHEDGCVRLWDTGSRVYVDATSGIVLAAGGGGDKDISAACPATVRVTDDANGGVMSCRFLPGFVDARPPTAAAAGAAADDVTSYLTPPFLTGSEGNTRITLWSPFTSTGSPPVPVRTFQIGHDRPLRERSIPMILGAGTTPSGQTHVFVADSEAGKIYVLHLSSAAGSYGKVATGFDYVVPFDTVHPIYSMRCTAASSSSGGVDVDTDNDDAAGGLSLYCVQSKAIQVLTFTGKMLAGPVAGASSAGVSVLQPASAVGAAAAAVTDEEEEGEANAEANAEALVAEFEEYEDGEEEDGAGGGADEDFEEYEDEEVDEDDDDSEEEGDNAAPAAAASGADPFSNWLGALAAGTAGGAPAPAPGSSTPPPPGMVPAQSEGGFPSILPPPGAAGVPPTPAPTPMVVPKPAPPPGLVQQALLNPMDLLSPSAASKDDDNQEDATASNPAEKKVGTQRQQQKQKPEEKKRPKSNPKQKKGKNGDAATVAANAPGKIAILKRDETPVMDNTSAPEVSVASSSGPITTHAALVEDVRVAIRTELLSAGLAGPGAKREQPSTDALASAVSKSVARALEKSLADPVKKSVEKIVAADKSRQGGAADGVRAEALTAAVVEGVQQPVVEAFHKTMRDVFIPAYEAGTRQMIAQTSTILSQGMANMAAEQTRALQELRPSGPDEATLRTMQSMAAQMENLALQVDNLKGEVARLSSTIPRQGASLGPPGVAQPMMQAPVLTPPPQVDPAQLLREEIVALLRQRSYDEAFTKALAAPAGNGVFALFACKNSNLQDVLEGESGPMLSQHILLCLAQQLGALLPNASGPDLRCCLTWLQDVAVTLDPNNPNIARHIGGVLTQLVGIINAKMAEGDPSLQRPLRMLLQVIRGIGN